MVNRSTLHGLGLGLARTWASRRLLRATNTTQSWSTGRKPRRRINQRGTRRLDVDGPWRFSPHKSIAGRHGAAGLCRGRPMHRCTDSALRGLAFATGPIAAGRPTSLSGCETCGANVADGRRTIRPDSLDGSSSSSGPDRTAAAAAAGAGSSREQQAAAGSTAVFRQSPRGPFPDGCRRRPVFLVSLVSLVSLVFPHTGPMTNCTLQWCRRPMPWAAGHGGTSPGGCRAQLGAASGAARDGDGLKRLKSGRRGRPSRRDSRIGMTVSSTLAPLPVAAAAMPPPRRALGPLAAAAAVVVALAASRGAAVGVAPSSPCAVQCGNDLSSTSGADLVCGDASYGSQAGQTFEACVGCELDSAYVDAATGESDLHWLLCRRASRRPRRD